MGGKQLTGEELAALIVDALVDAGLIQHERLKEAVAIAAQEIEVRKAAGDY